MREVREETGIGREEYNILSGITKNVVIVCGNHNYDIKYYVAVAGEELAKRDVFEMNSIHDNEVLQIQWKSLSEIRSIDTIDKKLERIVRDVFAVSKLYFNIKLDTNRTNILSTFENVYRNDHAILVED
ncbi:Uncharacterised protein [uncultured archaeon]|nr:Uncharacterised protein [uncultured archaeon]